MPLSSNQLVSSIRLYADGPRSRSEPSKNLSEMGENARKEVKDAVSSVLESVGGSGGKRGGLPADSPPEEGSTQEVVTDLVRPRSPHSLFHW